MSTSEADTGNETYSGPGLEAEPSPELTASQTVKTEDERPQEILTLRQQPPTSRSKKKLALKKVTAAQTLDAQVWICRNFCLIWNAPK